ncbi:sulfite exporter TauE/SafE family protein [Gemmatimonas sp. UBA7669]|uniref:sulfite exporter TauE/SafE family protein n=1 Tax=Gemmatimonas sp. UBA7669 TaxID=1946568 RepID=UPI0025BE586F|nr:sulfite exporter TauE/SafE family protein [Gemmatimonas sp. UBA7669]
MLLTEPSVSQLTAIAAVSAVSGMVNSIAGGGTLLTFPALLGLGVPPVAANATSTVALWPGSLASMLGYRRELAGAERWALKLAAPSIAGGLLGALLLMATTDEQFRRIVPWLVFGATLLFAFQARVMRWLRSYTEQPHGESPIEPTRGMMAAQFFVSIYGGYFGAGAGIVMLAVFGLMGMTNIHRMNGLKNFNGICFNGVAAATFAFKGLVNWPIALVMALGSSVGGYAMSGLAQRVPQAWVRGAVTLIGVASALWLFVTR